MSNVRSMLGQRVAGLAVIVSEMSPEVIQEIESSNCRPCSTTWARPDPRH